MGYTDTVLKTPAKNPKPTVMRAYIAAATLLNTAALITAATFTPHTCEVKHSHMPYEDATDLVETISGEL